MKEKQGGGINEGRMFEGAETGKGERQERTMQFRIHSVTVEFSGEILTGW